MKLKHIDKTIYRKRMNILLAITVTVLLVTSLGVSQLLITRFGSGVDGDHFWLNLVGVVAGICAISLVYRILLAKPFMAEVQYVKELKREMNRIYRSSKLLQQRVAENNKDALIISYFNLQASKQVYELDNNTLTMDELNEKIRLLDEQLSQLDLKVTTDDYSPQLLASLKQA